MMTSEKSDSSIKTKENKELTPDDSSPTQVLNLEQRLASASTEAVEVYLTVFPKKPNYFDFQAKKTRALSQIHGEYVLHENSLFRAGNCLATDVSLKLLSGKGEKQEGLELEISYEMSPESGPLSDLCELYDYSPTTTQNLKESLIYTPNLDWRLTRRKIVPKEVSVAASMPHAASMSINSQNPNQTTLAILSVLLTILWFTRFLNFKFLRKLNKNPKGIF